MSKLFKKLSGVSLGLALCFGFSFSCSNKSSGQMTRAAGDSVTFTPNNCTDMTSSQAEQTQTINPITFTISSGMNSGQLRIYKNETATFTATSGYNITSIEFTCTASGTTKYGPGCFADLTGYTYSGSVGTWTGLASSVTFTASSNQVRATQIVVEYASASSNPTVNVDDSLTLNVAQTGGKTLTATTELITDPVYSWTTNDNNITLEDASTSTVKIKPNTTSAGNATVSLNVSGTNSTTNANVSIDKEISVTLEEPLTVSEALALVENADSNTIFEGKYVKGIVSAIVTIDTSHGNANYYISDDGTENSQLYVYRGNFLNNAGFTDANQLQTGDSVVIYGDLKNYNGDTPEFLQGSYLVSLTSEARLLVSPTTIQVTVGTDGQVSAIPSNFAAGTITYSFDEDECATLSYSGNTIIVHGDSVGSYEFTIVGKVGENVQASAKLTVNVVEKYPVSISRSGYSSFIDSQTFAEGTGSITITYSDDSTATKYLGDEGVELSISDYQVDVSSLAAPYTGANSARITYSENGRTISTSVYILNVNPEVQVVSFDNAPEYLIIDANDAKHSATMTVNYKCCIGTPELNVYSSNPSKLTVSYNDSNNQYNSETKFGSATFEITAGDSICQSSVVVSLSNGTRTDSKSFSVSILGEEPSTGAGSYILVSSYGEIENGTYVIAGVKNGAYYGMTTSLNNGKLAGTALTVNNGAIASEVTNAMKFTITKQTNGGYTIMNGSDYIGLPASNSSNLTVGNVNKTEWVVSAGSHGTFRFKNPEYTSRGLVYRESLSAFSGYALSNVTSTSTDYFDIELFKYNEGENGSFGLIETFVKNYMHMSDVSIGNNDDTGACKGDDGYYLTAKKAWNSMVDAYQGDDDLQTVFAESFTDAYNRYLAWAAAMGDRNPFDGNNSVQNSLANSRLSGDLIDNDNATMLIVFAVCSLGAGALSAFYLVKKRKRAQ